MSFKAAFAITGLIVALASAQAQTVAEPSGPSERRVDERDGTPPTEMSLRTALGGPGLADQSTLKFNTSNDLFGILNVIAGRTHRVDALRSFFGLSGAGILVGVFEANGRVVTNHEAFGNRVLQGDNYASYSRHATHVAGTIAAEPPTNDARKVLARGMAPAARVVAFEANTGFEEEMTNADATMVASNHSYGPVSAWESEDDDTCDAATDPPNPRPIRCGSWNGIPTDVEDRDFGRYTDRSALFDRLAVARPQTSMFISAGNDRDDAPPTPFNGWHIDGNVWSNQNHRNPDGWDRGGYDTISGGQASAKNTITIGAIIDVSNGITPSQVTVTNFTGWGPTDDGRLKPDLVANGLWLFSTSYRDRAGVPDPAFYEEMAGTSMAAPVATGITALLNELARRERGSTLMSDELKAILIHTAISPTIGPNYRTGWGAIDAMEAGNIVANRLRGTSFRRERLGAARFEQPMTARAGESIKVTLVWLDAPGTVRAGLDDATATLVNDLDLELVAPDGTVHVPWSLDPRNPDQPARRCSYAPQAAACLANHRDTVEQIDVPSSAVTAGQWTVRVRGPANLQNQMFTLVFTGLD